jgi:uncharacterized membrane protein YdjX (TVP38/TMEM64 family)
MKKKNLKIIILAAFIISAVVLTRALNLDEYLEQDRLRGWIDGFGALGPLVYILLYSIAPSLMFPGLALTVVGGILFGPYWGSLYVAVGATIGASLAFLLARYMGRDWVAGILKGGKLAEIDAEVKSKGWKIVAFTRLIPLFPYNFLNYAFGLTNIRFSHYVIATFFFMIPGIVAYVVFSSSILDLFKGRVSREFIIGVVLVAIVSAIPIIYKRYKKGPIH